ncbi:ATP-dependent DNA helicase PIF1, partial [Aphelenchoides avenae]
TRLMVTKLGKRVIECEHLNGPRSGGHELIPRIKLFSDATELPFVFARTQFPIRPAFAMSINKSQ